VNPSTRAQSTQDPVEFRYSDLAAVASCGDAHQLDGAFRVSQLVKDTALQLGQPTEGQAGRSVQKVVLAALIGRKVHARPQPKCLTVASGAGAHTGAAAG
jgi:hypothetical protein